MKKSLNNAENHTEYYPNEQKRDAPMYKKMPLEGRMKTSGIVFQKAHEGTH